jgi:internalin A
MKAFTLFYLGITATVLAIATHPSSVMAIPPQPKTFVQWCEEKESVPAETKLTIDKLLNKAGTKDCKQADLKLRSLTKIELHSMDVSEAFTGADGKPHVNIEIRGITDLRPLASLTNLTHLDLSENLIQDLQPLASLTNLIHLDLNTNRLSDLKPLTSLNKLTYLDLGLDYQNRYHRLPMDIKPLSSMVSLTELNLEGRTLDDVQPLASLTKLTKLNLSHNQISNLQPLSELNNLTYLNLQSNPIQLPICPVMPGSICKF